MGFTFWKFNITMENHHFVLGKSTISMGHFRVRKLLVITRRYNELSLLKGKKSIYHSYVLRDHGHIVIITIITTLLLIIIVITMIVIY